MTFSRFIWLWPALAGAWIFFFRFMVSSTKDEPTAAILEYIGTAINQRQVVLTSDTPLIEAGLLDSLSIFKLIQFMEERFGIKVEAEDVLVEHFENVETLARFVTAKLS